jgi:hypothetical protein
MTKRGSGSKLVRGPLSAAIDELQKAYIWKAENIVRWFDGLGMTKEQKVEFLAREFATVHWLQGVELLARTRKG